MCLTKVVLAESSTALEGILYVAFFAGLIIGILAKRR
jgi:hypothetical protein